MTVSAHLPGQTGLPLPAPLPLLLPTPVGIPGVSRPCPGAHAGTRLSSASHTDARVNLSTTATAEYMHGACVCHLIWRDNSMTLRCCEVGALFHRQARSSSDPSQSISFLRGSKLDVIQPNLPRNEIVELPAGQAGNPHNDQFGFWSGSEIQKQSRPPVGTAGKIVS